MPWHSDRPRLGEDRDQRGEEHSYSVATWRSEAKAIALAVARHRALGRGYIYDVRAQGLGTVALSGDGELVAPDEDRVDHYEW